MTGHRSKPTPRDQGGPLTPSTPPHAGRLRKGAGQGEKRDAGLAAPGQCCRLVQQKDTAVVVHLQHTPGRKENSASVNASTSTVFGRGRQLPQPCVLCWR